MATYTQPAGDSTASYFQDVALSPANLKSGAILQRLSTKHYPKKGVHNPSVPLVSGVVPASVTHGTTATVEVDGQHLERGAAVTVSGTGVTVNSVNRKGQKDRALTVNVTVDPAATVGARDVVVTNSDTGTVTATGALSVA